MNLTPIWFKSYGLEDLQKRGIGTLVEYLGIEIDDIGPDFLCGTMPVRGQTCRPGGILHGGASCVLAESLGSVAANMCIDPQKYNAVGLEINANHLKAVPLGQQVSGVARPLHLGRSTQVWEIKITNSQGQLTCISRLTMAIITIS